ncbi:MAG: hypothetical protein JSS07_01475 [Proteobacteria bacterium]|nr:hypothetical protein [Pseudomonadota bacterium]
MLTHLIKTDKITRYGLEFNSHDLIKVIAISLMILDHIGLYLLHDNPWARLFGRGAAVLFFFLIGYSAKLNAKSTILCYGLILSLSDYLVNKNLQANILINFIIISYAMIHFPPERLSTFNRSFLFIAFTLMNVFVFFYIEYGLLGFLIAYSARLIALKDKQADFWFFLTLIVYYLWESAYFQFYKLPQGMFIFGVLILCLFLLRYYRLMPLACPKPLLWPGLILSRYSLEIYFIHLIILQSFKLLHLL